MAIFLFGFPLIYLIRDGIGLAPGSNIFTQLMLLLSLLLMFPLLNINKIYTSDTKLLLFVIIFHFVAIIYALFYKSAGTNSFFEVLYLTVNLFFLLLLSFIKHDDLEAGFFLKFIFYLALFQNIGILLYAATNGNLQFGVRFNLAMETKTGDVVGVTNPHLFAKSAYMSIVCSYAIFKYKIKGVSYFSLSIALLVALVMLAFTLSVATFISLFLFIVFIFFNLPKGTISRFVSNKIRNPYFVVILLGFSVYLITVYKKYEYLIEVTFKMIFSRFERIFSTIFNTGVAAKAAKLVDASAGERIENFNTFLQIIQSDLDNGRIIKLLFGHGYNYWYLDLPFIQTFQDLGLFGFSLFLFWHVYCLRLLSRYFKQNTSPVFFLLGGVFFLALVANVTQGLPYGYQNWIYMIFITRFLKNYKPVETY